MGLHTIRRREMGAALVPFYVVTTAFVDREIQLELPESDASAIPEEKKKFTVEIGQSGALALNGKAMTIELLDRTIEVAAAADDIQSVEIRADRNVIHGRVVQVLGVVKYLTQSAWSHASLYVGDERAAWSRAS